ncbi:ricin-type beta-trefoil lectin domain protein [Spirillospora sp. NPDC047279]|uniref:discoidin domain-containing protein n=1 Tax=Spirillospora sp. NPDC047279 TaxID=3155478 RepID=UPI0033FAFD31
MAAATSVPRRLVAAMCALLLVPVVAIMAATPPATAAAAVPAGFSEQVVFSGLTNPSNVEFADDGRVFVAEKSGVIKVFDSLADTTPAVYADLRAKVHNYWDRGLLGMALHPDFPTDPRIYVLYTYDGLIGGPFPKWGTATSVGDPCPTPPGPTSDGCQVSGRLSALTPSGTAVAEQVLIEDWCQQFPSHSVGTVAFGADGMLYAGGGDGASFNYTDYGQDVFAESDVTPDNPCGDPPSAVGTALSAPSAQGGALRSQDLRTGGDPATLDGGLIRVHPDTGAAAPGNPLSASADPNTRRLTGQGLRNPFRFTVRPGTNEIWAGDVGWGTWEEINRVVSPTAGVTNFGWPCYEGSGRQSGYDGADLSLCENLYAAGTGAVAAPYYAYNHGAQVVPGETCTTGSSSIGGLAFYPGGNYPAAYDGALFFSDYSRKCAWAMRAGTDGLPNPSDIITFATGYGMTELQAGPGGDIFAVDYDNGRIIRYVYNATNNPPTAVINADRTSGGAPLTVSFDGRASNDADGDPLTYAWDLDGDGGYDDSTAANPQRTYTAAGTVTVRLRVDDGRGGTGTASVGISVGNTAPTATISTPGPATRWNVGSTISFSGSATDPEQGTLPGSSLTWTLIMHHCPSDCHTHQVTTMTGTSGTFAAPDHEYPSYLELRLTAEDAGGLTDTKSVRLDPNTSALTFASTPAGLQLSYFSASATTPFARTAIVGSSGSISGPNVQTSANGVHRFVSWSDGGSRSHNITTPATAATYTATYRSKRNLALGRTVTTSSTPSTGLEAARAVDGSMSTRWSSPYSDPQWIQVDLGGTHSVDRVLLNWEAAFGRAYRVDVSTNGTTWTTVHSTTTGDGGTDHITFTPTDARYVRLHGTARGTQWGYSLWELGVFGETGRVTGVGSKCTEVTGGATADGTQIRLATCTGGAPQRWTLPEDRTVRSLGKCLDARTTTNGAPVVLWTCDGSGGQTWLPRADGTLLNTRSGRCYDAEGNSSADGTRLIIWTCHTGANQKWVLP